MSDAQTSAPTLTPEETRRRPLAQYVVSRYPYTLEGQRHSGFRVFRSAAGSKPSHWLIDPPSHVCSVATIEAARAQIPSGFRNLGRRKDDPVDVVETWV